VQTAAAAETAAEASGRAGGARARAGFGGKVEASDASVLAAAARELKEEAGIECPDLEARAVVEFSFDDGGKTPDIVMYVFLGSRVVGEPVESSEMRPQWFETERIPFEQMWADDRLWLPWLLAGKRFRGRFAFAADHITILNYELVSDAVADIALPA
jgi:8-oxo-dGTP pyrophosphatase MutT (NUDIX family)